MQKSSTRVHLQTVHHKADPALPIFKKYFSPIQVGSLHTHGDLGIDRDDRGVNIAKKNATYCELTAMYWAWKNVDADFYGLMHYRRMFTARGSSFAHRMHMAKQWIGGVRECLQYREVGNLWPRTRVIRDAGELELECRSLQGFLARDPIAWDVLLPSPVYSRKLGMAKQYALSNCQSDYLCMTDCIRELFPDMESTMAAASSSRLFWLYNMFVMRWSVFDDYASRLFKLLAEVEQRIDVTRRDAYQRRAFGFLAERFLNIYFHHAAEKTSLRIMELPTVFVEFR